MLCLIAFFLIGLQASNSALRSSVDKNAHEAIKTTRIVAQNILFELERHVDDNSQWYEFYDAIKTNDQTWFRENIFEANWAIQPDVMAVYDAKGNRMAIGGVKLKPTERFIPKAEVLKGVKEVTSGFTFFNGKGASYAYSLAPMRKGDGSGPIVGAFAMAKRIDKDFAGMIEHWTRLPLCLTDPSGKVVALSKSVSKAPETAGSGETIAFVDRKSRWAFTTFEANGKPMFRIGVLYVDPAGSVIDRTARSLVVSAPFVILLAGVCVAVIIGWSAHSSMSDWRKALAAIENGDLSRRLSVSNNGDVFDDVARRFNEMMNELEQNIGSLNNKVTQQDAQLVQASKLASVGTLASGVAHELNQPLAIIRAISQQCLSDPKIAEDEQLTHDIKLMERQTYRMTQIIDHLRSFARKPGDDFEPICPRETIENSLVLFKEQLRTRDIELTEEIAEDLPPIWANGNSIEQVIINLVANARDALEETNEAKIHIVARLTEDGERVRIEVDDNGPGVSDEAAAQIFDPFFTTKEPGKGTGLGLSISFDIARKHNGAIGVKQSSMGGAQFYIEIPVWKTNIDAA